MKYPSGRRFWAARLGGYAIFVIAAVLVGGRSNAALGTEFVQVAFTATLTSSDGVPIAARYQRVTLNVISVRLNPSRDTTISQADPGWVEIPAPAEIGSTNPDQFITTSLNFGGTGTLLSAATSILQLDLIPLQNLPFFFNGATIPAQNYGQMEIQLNPDNPGTVVPLCHSASEGCISYPVALSQASGLQVLFGFPFFPVATTKVQPLVVNINAVLGPAPSGNPSTQTAALSPIITPQGAPLPGGTTPYNPNNLGVVTGVVNNANLSTTLVTAELAGTNQIIVTSHLLPDGNPTTGTFILNLPALPTTGTSYDFYISGSSGYVVKSHVLVLPGSNPELNFAIPFSTFGTLSGTVADNCTGAAVQAATLNLLMPDTTAPGSATTCDLSGTPSAIPPNCVVVATAASDDQGNYPTISTPFTQVAAFPPPGVQHYDLQVSAPGYNTSVVPVTPGSLGCAGASTCRVRLDHGFFMGLTTLGGPNTTGNRLNAMVIAEDHGTNHIENVGLSTIPGGANAGTYTMLVPDAAPPPTTNSIPVSSFDLFASVQDLFQGMPEKTSGHLIGTVANVGAPSSCGTIPVPALSPMDCAGLGSVFGNVGSANPGTTAVALLKNGVQIMQTGANSVAPPATPGGANYNFCAPADTYNLNHLENGVLSSSIPITLTPPGFVSGVPCSSICQNAAGVCLVCRPTIAPLLP